MRYHRRRMLDSPASRLTPAPAAATGTLDASGAPRSWAGRGPALMALAMLLWVATETANFLVVGHASIPQVEWLRYALHLGLMLIVFGPRYGLALIRTSRPALQLGRSLLLLGMPLCFLVASREMSGARILGGFFAAPLFVLLFARVFGDRAGWTAVVLSVAGWAGAVAIFGRPPAHPLGLVAVGGMAATFAWYFVLTAVLGRTETLLANLFHLALGGFVALTLAIRWWWVPLTPRALAAGAVVAVLGWLTLAAMDLALRADRPANLSLFVFAYVIAHQVLRLAGGSRPGPIELAGTLCVAGVLVAALALGRRSPPDALPRHASSS